MIFFKFHSRHFNTSVTILASFKIYWLFWPFLGSASGRVLWYPLALIALAVAVALLRGATWALERFVSQNNLTV
jgi:hypothetical protein